jgi:hypothetical protein
VQINLRFMFRLSSFGAKLARSLGSGCSGNTKQALKKHFQHKGMCLRPATFGFCTRKHTQVQKPVMPGVSVSRAWSNFKGHSFYCGS